MTPGRRLACLLVAASLLAACSTQAQAQVEGNTAERLRIAWPADDGTLTPYTFDIGYPLMTLVYDTLLWRGGDTDEWLALREPRRSEAGRRVTVLLREGARWHDGRPLTARDVKFSFDYYAERYNPRFTPLLEAIESTEVVDKRTVAFNLRHPSPGFNDLPLSNVPILPRHLWRGLGRGETPPGLPVGSGPYRLVERTPGERYVFEANDDYFLGRPRVRTLELPFNRDFDETLRQLGSRDVDMVPAPLSEKNQEDIRESSFETEQGLYYTGTSLTLNLREPPFNSARARRAVSEALDLRRITRATVGVSENSFAADRGYVHPQSGRASEGELHRFDLARARAEFAALDLPPITVLAPENDPVRRTAGEQVVLALTRAGADAKLETMSAGELEGNDTPSFEAAIRPIPPLASYNPDYLRLLFGSQERQAPFNRSGYRSEEFDDLAERAARETNPFERSQLIRQELRLLEQDAPEIPLFYPEGAFVFRPSIYDGWDYVEGQGILDKRSFLQTDIDAGGRPGAAPPAAPAGASGGGGIGVLGVVALAMLGLVVVVIAVGVVRRARQS